MGELAWGIASEVVEHGKMRVAVGMETLYVVASYEPLKEVENLLSERIGGFERTVDRLGDEQGELHVFSTRGGKEDMDGKRLVLPVLTRGVHIVEGRPMTYALSDGRRIEKAPEVIEGGEWVVRVVSFQYR